MDALAPVDAQRVLAATRRRTFARGEIVFHRDDLADALHLVRRGRFAVKVVTPLGDTAILTVIGRDGFFGEVALLGWPEGRRSASIVALEAGETLALHRDDFEALRRARPELREVVERALTEQVRRLTEHLVEALFVPADARVRRRLAAVAEIYREGDGAVEVPLTQDVLAGMAGTSRATVNRVLRAEEQRGHVALGRGRVTVVDAVALGR